MIGGGRWPLVAIFALLGKTGTPQKEPKDPRFLLWIRTGLAGLLWALFFGVLPRFMGKWIRHLQRREYAPAPSR